MTIHQSRDGASTAAGVTVAWRGARVAPPAIAALLVLAIVLLLRGTLVHMVETWDSDTYGHGFLIFPACAYLAWRIRDRAATLPLQPDFRGLFAIAALALVWLAGHVSETYVIQELAFVALIQAAIVTVLGVPAARAFLFPLAYMYFAVPIGDSIIPELRAMTAWFAVGLLNVAGIPVFSDGYTISVPNANWLVADACSSIRYLISSITVGCLFAAIVYA
ncbi:MAG: exosortase, partial [Stellaceae bacterium]